MEVVMDKLKTIPLEAISIPEDHLRVQSVGEKELKKLSESILLAGLLVRIIVRPAGEGKYELVDGERRLRSYRMLFDKEGQKWIGIPAIVQDISPKEAIRRQVVINENRKDLTPFEKCKGFKLAWDTGYFQSFRELGDVVGKSHTTVSRAINVFDTLPSEVLNGFETGEIKQTHLRYFPKLKNRQLKRKLFRAIINDNLNSAETRELANRLDDRWLSGDRELLLQIAEKDAGIKDLLGEEIEISDLVNKSKCTVTYTTLAGFKELIGLLYKMVKSGAFGTTLSQYKEQQ